jgi:hypothetical protein
VSPSSDSWIYAGSGISGVHFAYTIRRHDTGVHVWIERPSAEENHAILRGLELDREVIEAEFGGPLDWDHREGRKRCSVGVVLPGGGYRDDEEDWPSIQDRMAGAMARLEAAVRDRVPAAASELTS